MKIKRYDFGTEYRGRTGTPAIVESADGQYVRYDDYKALLDKMEAIGAVGVSAQRITTPERPRDGYEELRSALDAGPTRGPWKVDKERGARNWLVSLDAGDKGRGIGIAETRSGVTVSAEIANALWIAAASPDTIRALLDDLDRLRNALWITTEHNALYFGENHNTVIQGRAALAQEQS